MYLYLEYMKIEQGMEEYILYSPRLHQKWLIKELKHQHILLKKLIILTIGMNGHAPQSSSISKHSKFRTSSCQTSITSEMMQVLKYTEVATVTRRQERNEEQIVQSHNYIAGLRGVEGKESKDRIEDNFLNTEFAKLGEVHLKMQVLAGKIYPTKFERHSMKNKIITFESSRLNHFIIFQPNSTIERYKKLSGCRSSLCTFVRGCCNKLNPRKSQLQVP